ncbi:MAG TPA: hypothetical protein VNO21_17680 [Polyangiaceae bacterium]|nr:hypothetical protein [Polyangiaceae bacterium]
MRRERLGCESRQDRKRFAEDGLDRWSQTIPALLDDAERTARLLLFEPHRVQRAECHLGFVPALARVGSLRGLLLLDVFTAKVAFGRK